MNKPVLNEKGVTLIELLLTVVISAIAAGLIYSVFLTGIKLYQKTQVESGLRDNADYIATMILNEMYNSPPTYVRNLEDGKGIELVRNKDKTVEGYLIEDSVQTASTVRISIEENEITIIRNNEVPIKLLTHSTELAEADDGSGSSLTISNVKKDTVTGRFKHGTINLTLVLNDSSHQEGSLINVKPLVLRSSFGF
ncbi:PilW family protein [Peribacillus sp. SCS-37]|uniref:PilW family protein n=1 Tax=Paraperibacillus esterisolvens TaxID=3115296 RepID=UPI0039064301